MAVPKKKKIKKKKFLLILKEKKKLYKFINLNFYKIKLKNIRLNLKFKEKK
jgi:hypothetical protein